MADTMGNRSPRSICRRWEVAVNAAESAAQTDELVEDLLARVVLA